MVQTSRWGFSEFGGALGGSISDDDGKYSSTDRVLQDRLFTFFENHTHDGGDAPAPLASPANAPVAAVSDTGGTIPRGGTRYYRYTIVDRYGFESAGSPEVAAVIPDTISITVTPVVVGGDAGGSALAPGTYYYALTGNTADGETIIGPEAVITIQVGQSQAVLTLPDLPSGVTSWNVWRMAVTEDGWTKVFDSQAPGDVTDVGIASGDCLCDPTTQPPTLDLAPGGTISVTVTPHTGDLTGAISWRLYETDTSGSYANASLVATVVPTILGDPLPVSYVDTGTALLAGQPPRTSTTITPSHSVTGGSGGGGADSHWVSDVAEQPLPVLSGDIKSIYIEGTPFDGVGHDIVAVYELHDELFGDALQIDTAAVYSFFGQIAVSGAAAGDQFAVVVSWNAGGPTPNYLPATLGVLVIPPGQTSGVSGWMMPPVFIPKGTRISFQVSSWTSGALPTEIQASIGAAMASGSPAPAEVYPAPASLTTTVSGAGNIHVGWTVNADDTEYHVLVYDRSAAGGPVVKHVETAGASDFGPLTIGHDYDVVALARKSIDSVDLFSTAAIASASLNPSSGYFADNFNRADSALGLPDWIVGLGDPAGAMTVEGNALANSGTGAVAYALHSIGTEAKWITFTHTAPASGAAVVAMLANGFTLSNPRALLTVDPTAVAAPTIDYYDGGGTHTVVIMTAEGGGLTAYDGSSATLRATIHGDQVMLYQGGTLVAIGIIPAAITPTCGGVGLNPTVSNGGTIDNFEIANYRSTAAPGLGGSQQILAGGGTYAAEKIPVDNATAGHIGVVAIYGLSTTPTLDGWTLLFEQHDGTGYLSVWTKVLDGSESTGIQVYSKTSPFVGIYRSYAGSAASGSGATGNSTPTETVAIGDAIVSFVGGVVAGTDNSPSGNDPHTGGWNDVVDSVATLVLMSADEDSAIAGTSEARTMTVGGTSPTYSAATVVVTP